MQTYLRTKKRIADAWKQAIVAVAGIAVGLFIFYGPIVDLLRALSG